MDTIVKWQKKFNALPRIPRSQSKLGYVDTLKTIFHEINSKKELEETIKIDGSNTNHSLIHYIEILLRYQFIRVDDKNIYYVL